MKKRTRSILEELNDMHVVDTVQENLVDSRATHVIQSAINIIGMIRESFDIETANDLEKRFLNAIKSGDPSKFARGIRKLKKESNSNDT
jgi:hypothetical protein